MGQQSGSESESGWSPNPVSEGAGAVAEGEDAQRDRRSDALSLPTVFLQEFLYRTAGGLPYWIGLTKAGSEGDWHWVDGTPYNKVQSEK